MRSHPDHIERFVKATGPIRRCVFVDEQGRRVAKVTDAVEVIACRQSGGGLLTIRIAPQEAAALIRPTS